MKTAWIFRPSKLHRKGTWKQRRFFDHQNYIQKSTWKQGRFFNHRNYIKKSMWEQGRFFNHRNYIKKSTWKQGRFFNHRNYIEKSTWKQRGFFDHGNLSKKVGGNDVDFSISEITSKKYVEMTWKFVEIWSSTYRRNIHVESTSIRVPVKYLVV